MKLYHNEKLIKDIEDISSLYEVISNFLKSKGIKNDYYLRFVELENGRTMIDYGSWSNFFFIDCSYSEILKNDKTRNLPTHKD